MIEGLSLIFLVFLAMPLKYFWDMPEYVSVLGRIHGFLFMLFFLMVVIVAIQLRWKFFGKTLVMLISCLIPFANFYVDKTILKPEQQRVQAE